MCRGMMIRSDGLHVAQGATWANVCAFVYRSPANAKGMGDTPPDGVTNHQNHRLSLQLVGSMGAARPEGRGFLGSGVMIGVK